MTSENIKKNINSIINYNIAVEHLYTQAEFGDLCEPIDGENQYEDNYFAHPIALDKL